MEGAGQCRRMRSAGRTWVLKGGSLRTAEASGEEPGALKDRD